MKKLVLKRDENSPKSEWVEEELSSSEIYDYAYEKGIWEGIMICFITAIALRYLGYF
jgi:hypothetical protein